MVINDSRKSMIDERGALLSSAFANKDSPPYSITPARSVESGGGKKSTSSNLPTIMENRLSYLLRSIGCFLALTLLLALFSCQTTTTKKSGGSATLHAIHSEKLKGVMSDISGVAFNRLPQELGNPHNSGSPDLRKVAAAAGALNRAASRIPAAVNSVSLEPAEEQVFLTLARRLKTQTSQLESQARSGDLSNVRLTMRQMSSTCNSCHTLFRGYGPMISLF